MTPEAPRVIIVMGVSGAGKSTVGERLARALGAHFVEGDSYHPPANVEKMAAGQPLVDADREPWLAALADAIAGWLASGERTVLACSALKAGYRARLTGGREDVRFLHLSGDADIIARRLASRPGHFMPASLLESQLRDLEAPSDAIHLDIAETPARIVARALAELEP